MKTTATSFGPLVLALLVGHTVLAADTQPAPPVVVPPPAARNPVPEMIPGSPAIAPRADGLPPGSVASPWIEYSRPDCCGPLGGGPIGGEWYLRTGPSKPVSNGILNDTLDTGWMGQLGARSLFFNSDTTAAWTADAGVSYTFNNGRRADLPYNVPFLVSIPDPNNQLNPNMIVQQDITVTTRDYQRTSFNLAFGREWYILKPAYSPGWHWRVGTDVGGRWGYSRVGFNDLTNAPIRITYRHKSDVFGALALSLHEDLEIPLSGGATFICGLRSEWVYNWTDVVPAAAGRDLQDVNILLNFGWRY